MISEKRSQAARVNGAKSRGPKTPEGKRRSSQNATAHGLLTKIVLLPGEINEGFDHVVNFHEERFHPTDDFEQNLVHEMAVSHWRLHRAWALEQGMMTRAMENHLNEQTNLGRLVAGFCELADGPRLALLHRYEARLHMMYQRALKTLILNRNPPLTEPDSLNEPTVKPGDASSEVAPNRSEPDSIPVASPDPSSVPQPSETSAPVAIRTQDAELPIEPKPGPAVPRSTSRDAEPSIELDPPPTGNSLPRARFDPRRPTYQTNPSRHRSMTAADSDGDLDDFYERLASRSNVVLHIRP